MDFKLVSKCALLGAMFIIAPIKAQTTQDSLQTSAPTQHQHPFTLGAYAEAFYTRNFYSDNMFRYSHAASYADAEGHGRIDLPHACINLGYDFGQGWTIGTEIEFEHGGTESAIEVEAEETGEFEKELERGGEVALEQLWIQKRFSKALNIRIGHIIVPVGQTNNAHLPTDFLTAYRPEGENTILPCTWHETGISIWGKLGSWRYEAVLIPSLNSSMFNHSGWIHNGSASPYEFKVANKLAIAGRIDNYSFRNLHLGISGYVGNSFQNDIVTDQLPDRFKNVKGTVVIGAIEFDYKTANFIARGNFDYGTLSDAGLISIYNTSLSNSSQSPYPHTFVGQAAIAAGAEIAYNILRNSDCAGRKLYIFGRYDYYDSYIPVPSLTDYAWTDRHIGTIGINYYPIKEIVIKAEASHRFLKSQYNDEPSFSIGIAYSGFFIR